MGKGCRVGVRGSLLEKADFQPFFGLTGAGRSYWPGPGLRRWFYLDGW